MSELRVAFVAYIECEVRGKWLNVRESHSDVALEPQDRQTYQAGANAGCEVHLVRPDGLKRIFEFKKGAKVVVAQGIIRFNQPEFARDHDRRRRACR